METLPVPVGAIGAPASSLADSLASAWDYALNEKSEATRKAYRSDFSQFTTWCRAHELEHLPASIEATVGYLAHLADTGSKASTITRRAAAIGYAHRLAGFEPPTNAEPVKAVLRGIRRRIGVAVEQKAPATARAITLMVRKIPDTRKGKRDRAMILLGFAAALRRSELVSIAVEDLEWRADGVIVRIRRSKTDQEGAGHEVAIPRGSKLKPVEAIRAWLDISGITSGPIFPFSDATVANVVKRWAEVAGIDPTTVSGHSLRAGFVTSALESGADLLKIMEITRHREVSTLKTYDRRAKSFINHAGKSFL